MRGDPFRPAKRVAGQRKDVWYAQECCLLYSPHAHALSRSIVNEAASESKIEGGMVNMGQGFFGYNRKNHPIPYITWSAADIDIVL
jgi:kynurenine aminotransferase